MGVSKMKMSRILKIGAVLPLFVIVSPSLTVASGAPANEDSLIVNIHDTIATTYLNPFGRAGDIVRESSLVATANQNIPLTPMTEPNLAEIARTMMADPGKTQVPIVLNLSHANSGGQQSEPEGILDSSGAALFREAHIDGPLAGEPTLVPRGSNAEIPLAERFVTRSLDRNTAIIVIYVDGGDPSQFD